MLRQFIGQIQEFWQIYASPSLNHHHQRFYLVDLSDSSTDDGYYGFVMGGKSGALKMVETNKSPPTKKSRREKNHEKFLGMLANSSSTDIMEEEIWKELPEDLLDAVIARLPIATLFRFRTVCRKWNYLLTCNSFSQHFADVRVHPWFYTKVHENVNSGAIYDPSLKKWHYPSIPFPPAEMFIFPVASAGGLVCFFDIGHRKFYVSNPLTHSFKELPPSSVQVWPRTAVGMILNGNTVGNGYKIVWLGCNGDHEVYDSIENSWTRPGILPPSIKLPLSLYFRSQTLSIGSKLYFMREDPDGIVSYDVASGVWKQFIIPSLLHLTDHTLAEFRGRVMLVGLLTKNAATCVCIWELQKMTLLWKEVDRMPNIWCLDFYGKHVRMTCLGNQGLLMLSLRSRRMNRLVTYDMYNREWQKVPDCTLPCGRKRQWASCGTAFHPCPSALA